MQELIDKVVQWGHDRNLNAPENLNAQTMKLVSEFGEIGTALAMNDDREVIDGIGDTFVVAIIIGQQLGWQLTPSTIQQWDDPQFEGMRYEQASGRLGLFVDAVLKKNPPKQLRALLGEFVGAVCNFIKDWEIGYNVTLEGCLEAAYEQIKDRKGVMYHGAFIKESDPRYPETMEALNATDRYRKKASVVVEAITFEALVAHGIGMGAELVNGMPWAFTYKGQAITHENDNCYLIPTLEGTMRFERGAMLITGINGEIYPCAGDIFAKTYEPA